MRKETVRRIGWLLFSVTAALLFYGLSAVHEGQEPRQMSASAAARSDAQEYAQEDLEQKKVAISFDDGPHPTYTKQLLDGLKKRGVKATFFVTGEHAALHPDIIRRMSEEGHLIGNHTYDHVQLTKTDQKEAQMQIEKTGNRIYEITGEYPIFLRPPFGETREDLQLAVALFNVPWNVDTLDWKTKNADSILEIVQENVKDGSIILMHDGYASSVEGALAVVDYLQKEGYELVTVDRLLLV